MFLFVCEASVCCHCLCDHEFKHSSQCLTAGAVRDAASVISQEAMGTDGEASEDLTTRPGE